VNNYRLFRLLRDNPIVIVMVMLFALFSVIADGFADGDNISNILLQSSMLGLVAIGMSFVILTGGIDLSVGSVVALSTILVAGIANSWPPILGINAGLLAGAGIGFVNGALIAIVGLQPIIATLATMAIVRGLGMWLSDSRPIFGTLPEAYFGLANAEVFGVPVPVLVFSGVAAISIWFLHYTRTGRQIYQVGGNEEAANLAGIGVARIKILAYTLCGLLSAIAGLVLTARMQSGDAVRTGLGWELDAIAAAAVGGLSLMGGRGHLIGAVCGVLIIGMLSNAFNLMGVNPYWQRIVVGFVLALAVVAYSDAVRHRITAFRQRRRPTVASSKPPHSVLGQG
jgi:ribose/xylose/arabinose/galactoside ABC-type transport system permease subunit